jgi:hypothetical protein
MTLVQNHDPIVFTVDGIKTLPLYSLRAKTLEKIPALGSGQVHIEYVEPKINPSPYSYDPGTLDKVSHDWHFTEEVIKTWEPRVNELVYLHQFRDDPDQVVATALKNHSELLSHICDLRLGLDPTPINRLFRTIITLGFIQSDYRKDILREDRYEEYATKVARAQKDYAEKYVEAQELVSRMLRHLQAKELEWSKMAELAKSANQADTTPEFDDFRYHASGLYGEVYEAREVPLNRLVAIKVIQAAMVDQTSARAHGQVLAQLSHDNIVKVFRLAQVRLPNVAESVDALVMEWLEAVALSEKLKDGGLSLDEVLYIAESILKGLRHMHSRNVFHGDLNVGNILIGNDFVKIIDVRAMDRRTMAVYSTMTPEQKRDADVGALAKFVLMMLNRSSVDTTPLMDKVACLDSVKTLDEVDEFLGELSKIGTRGDAAVSEVAGSRDEGAVDPTVAESFGLSHKDMVVLGAVGDLVKDERSNEQNVRLSTVIEDVAFHKVSREEALASFQTLREKGFFRNKDSINSGSVQLSPEGFDAYLRGFEPEWSGVIAEAKRLIVHARERLATTLAISLKVSRAVAAHLLLLLERDGYIKTDRALLGPKITEVTGKLRRELEGSN